MLFGPAHEFMDLDGVPGKLELSGEVWEDGCTTKSKSLDILLVSMLIGVPTKGSGRFGEGGCRLGTCISDSLGLLEGDDSGVGFLPAQTSSIFERTLLIKAARVMTFSEAERLATVDRG